MTLNHTHNAATQSWLASANVAGCDFPIQNLPFAVCRRAGSSEAFRGAVAIGDQVIDLAQVSQTGCLDGLAAEAAATCAQPALNDFFAMGPAAWQALRHGLFALLEKSAAGQKVDALRTCLIPQSSVEFTVPARIGDYTDFYTSYNHAYNVGVMMRPDDPVSANFHAMPIAYHGRSSSIGVSGQKFRRPMGQTVKPGSTEPFYGPCTRLDYELELGTYIGQGNAQGEPIALKDAEKHIFGLCILNDWSARDFQFWEMTPLGPFLGKNFCTTISPWIVTLEALAPYRQAWTRASTAPQPLAYLDTLENRAQGTLDISLEVWLETEKCRSTHADPVRLSRTSFKHQHWTIAQMVTHHTMGGCNLQEGDLLGSGTISGPTEHEPGALLELSQGGKKTIQLDNGEQRTFLLDGDAVIMRGWCEKPGYARIGFGQSKGQVFPALA
ncbi:MAG: fumarylacetoacetase [Burkholderiaceae bacterium]|nr:fumarylacetoacetase [Burkholderiaceae bacterium]